MKIKEGIIPPKSNCLSNKKFPKIYLTSSQNILSNVNTDTRKTKNLTVEVKDLSDKIFKNSKTKNISFKQLLFPKSTVFEKKLKSPKNKLINNISSQTQFEVRSRKNTPNFTQKFKTEEEFIQSFDNEYYNEEVLIENPKSISSKGKKNLRILIKEFLLDEMNDLDKKIEEAQKTVREIRSENSLLSHKSINKINLNFVKNKPTTSKIEEISKNIKLTNIKQSQNNVFNKYHNESDLSIDFQDMTSDLDDNMLSEDTEVFSLMPRNNPKSSMSINSFNEKSTLSKSNPFK